MLLARCHLQVGDPFNYITVGQPELQGRIWTNIKNDPTFQVPGGRPIWVMDKDHVGVGESCITCRGHTNMWGNVMQC